MHHLLDGLVGHAVLSGRTDASAEGEDVDEDVVVDEDVLGANGRQVQYVIEVVKVSKYHDVILFRSDAVHLELRLRESHANEGLEFLDEFARTRFGLSLCNHLIDLSAHRRRPLRPFARFAASASLYLDSQN